MADKPFCITLDPDLEEPIRKYSRRQGCEDPDDLVNSALRMYIGTLQGAGTKEKDLAFENQIMRRRVWELEQELQRKDEQISVLLRLWEQCPLSEGEREVPPDLEEKISSLLQGLYNDYEKKDFSGADGGKPGRM
jgi:hypothetical protein